MKIDISIVNYKKNGAVCINLYIYTYNMYICNKCVYNVIAHYICNISMKFTEVARKRARSDEESVKL